MVLAALDRDPSRLESPVRVEAVKPPDVFGRLNKEHSVIMRFKRDTKGLYCVVHAVHAVHALVKTL